MEPIRIKRSRWANQWPFPLILPNKERRQRRMSRSSLFFPRQTNVLSPSIGKRRIQLEDDVRVTLSFGMPPILPNLQSSLPAIMLFSIFSSPFPPPLILWQQPMSSLSIFPCASKKSEVFKQIEPLKHRPSKSNSSLIPMLLLQRNISMKKERLWVPAPFHQP